MAAQEQRHLEAFDALMIERGVRPTVFAPVWHVAGYALGAATALLGPKAAMAATVAVETVIDAHYGEQAEALAGGADPKLAAMVDDFRAEEVEHRDTAAAHAGENGFPGDAGRHPRRLPPRHCGGEAGLVANLRPQPIAAAFEPVNICCTAGCCTGSPSGSRIRFCWLT